jgi:hypothetical protein
MPNIDKNPFAHLLLLEYFLKPEEIRRSLLSNELMSRIERKPCAEIDIPMRGKKNTETNSENSQTAKLSFNFSFNKKPTPSTLSQESLEIIEKQLKSHATQRLGRKLRQLCMPLNRLSCAQTQILEETEQCVASVAITANVSLIEAFEMCDRFLSRQNMSWEGLSQLLADGGVRLFDNELALVTPQADTLLTLRDFSVQFMDRGIDVGRDESRAKSNFIGDVTCEFNARSPFIRCAVNPCGPCEGCIHRESLDA